MTILYPAGYRRDWIDRNAVSVVKAYENLGVAPHGLTSRWVYTVTAGKKAILTYFFASITRMVAAAPVGQAIVYVSGFINGTGINPFSLPMMFNTIGENRQIIIPQCFLMAGADTLTAYTFDTSTGGQCAYSISAQFIEFDA